MGLGTVLVRMRGRTQIIGGNICHDVFREHPFLQAKRRILRSVCTGGRGVPDGRLSGRSGSPHRCDWVCAVNRHFSRDGPWPTSPARSGPLAAKVQTAAASGIPLRRARRTADPCEKYCETAREHFPRDLKSFLGRFFPLYTCDTFPNGRPYDQPQKDLWAIISLRAGWRARTAASP
jgi:hypothetical protein